jgi:hypothetical protein
MSYSEFPLPILQTTGLKAVANVWGGNNKREKIQSQYIKKCS